MSTQRNFSASFISSSLPVRHQQTVQKDTQLDGLRLEQAGYVRRVDELQVMLEGQQAAASCVQSKV
jgi:hypothetical protein